MLLTLCIGFLKPSMHKTVLVYDSDYVIQQVQKTTETTQTPVVKASKIAQTQAVKKEEPKTRLVTKAPIQKNEQVQKTVSVKQSGTKSIKSEEKKNKVQNNEDQSKEQIILWNKWRSDIQNQIMTDVKLPIIPQGTIFKFSFDVDKYGKISHVQTWSTNSLITPYAIQYIAPVIKSYQGREILTFPQGSNRISTAVEGGWKIAETSKYSSSSDFKDTEKIRK